MMPDDFERARWMEDYNGELGAVVLVLILGAALGGAALVGLLWIVAGVLS
ncbi:hypothetical protein [Pontibaca methylaminivorans]|uniref:Uncharacterized protein n=1 Tax=Pontibaca methylaminivorans TaxID=515897 RepID=A0A1R3WA72_9RHOB|nr:hypothetical protein [Pontibaca methylaminivorans]SIT74659.1 hypothetical protein SAMN05421849_0193 [Pontibaca methylaminivorans]